MLLSGARGRSRDAVELPFDWLRTGHRHRPPGVTRSGAGGYTGFESMKLWR